MYLVVGAVAVCTHMPVSIPGLCPRSPVYPAQLVGSPAGNRNCEVLSCGYATGMLSTEAVGDRKQKSKLHMQSMAFNKIGKPWF